MGRSRNKKTIIEDVTLDRYAAEGKSVARMEDGKTLFVTGGVPHDVVDVRIRKNKSAYAEGYVTTLKQPSPDRVSPFCNHFGQCGGCKWQMLPYTKQVAYKAVQVKDQLQRIGGIELPDIEPIVENSTDRRYRNKIEFTFSELPYLPTELIQNAGDDEIIQKPVLGFHAPGFFDKVVDIDMCHLIDEPVNAIKNFLRTFAYDNDLTFYNARTQTGFLRNVIIRLTSTSELMVNLVVREELPALFDILSQLKEKFPEITSLNYTINGKVNDTIYDLDVVCYHGSDHIIEFLEDFKFKISPKSFFQTNTRQAEQLYQIVRDFAGLSGNEVIYDLYCGTGSIGIFLSKGAKKIVGIEAVSDAIEDAKINAAWNGLDNTTFIAGDVIKVVDDHFYQKHGRPDVVITDPPRAGMHEKMIDQLIKMAAPRIVYVSCNPATQARDLKLLEPSYNVIRVKPVDMFPQTHHVENVALLTLK